MPQRYRIHIRQRAVKALSSLRTPDKRRIRNAIDKLADDPRPPGARKLADRHQLYRLRISYYRIIYQIKDRELLVLVVMWGTAATFTGDNVVGYVGKTYEMRSSTGSYSSTPPDVNIGYH